MRINMIPTTTDYYYDHERNNQRTINYYFKVETGEDKSMVEQTIQVRVSSPLSLALANEIVNDNIPEFATSSRLDKVYPTSLSAVTIWTGYREDYMSESIND